MKVLITGADGFLGKKLTSHLQNQDIDVAVTRRRTKIKEAVHPPCTPFDLDAENTHLAEILSRTDVLVHLAWGSTPGVSNKFPVDDVLQSVAGTVRLFDMSAKAGVKRIVFASSGGQVYGNVDSSSILESSVTNPTSAYGIGKLSCEKYLSLFRDLYGIEVISLRVANLYGPGQSLKDGFGVIPTFLSRLKSGLPLTIFGDGMNVRDFVYIDDVVNAFSIAISSGVQGVFNISSGRGISICEIIENMEKLTGCATKLEHVPARAADPIAVVLSNAAARTQLGWMPVVDFSAGLAATINACEEK